MITIIFKLLRKLYLTICFIDAIDEKVTIIKSNRGKALALHDGYQYHKIGTSAMGNISWRCRSRRTRPCCGGGIVTRIEKVIKRRDHICKQNHIENEKKKLDSKWKKHIGSMAAPMPPLLKEKMYKEYEALGLEKPTYKRIWNMRKKLH